MFAFIENLMWFHSSWAFLHGSFRPGEEVYMNCPPGMVHQTDECLLLLKTLYGLIQAARHYFDVFSEILIDIGFQQSPADPCLLLFKNALGLMLAIVCVDDVGLAYSSYALVEFIFPELKKRKINYTVENDLTDGFDSVCQGRNICVASSWNGRFPSTCF